MHGVRILARVTRLAGKQKRRMFRMSESDRLPAYKRTGSGEPRLNRNHSAAAVRSARIFGKLGAVLLALMLFAFASGCTKKVPPPPPPPPPAPTAPDTAARVDRPVINSFTAETSPAHRLQGGEARVQHSPRRAVLDRAFPVVHYELLHQQCHPHVDQPGH